MVAEKALHDRVFRRQLFNYINLTSWSRSAKAKRKLVQTIVSTIERLRVQLVDQAGLKVPELPSGNTRGLNTYLKTVTSSRVLLKKANTQKEEGTDVTSENGNSEWGWVVSHQVSFDSYNLTLDLGRTYRCCVLGRDFPAVDAPVPGRSYSVPFRAPTS